MQSPREVRITDIFNLGGHYDVTLFGREGAQELLNLFPVCHLLLAPPPPAPRVPLLDRNLAAAKRPLRVVKKNGERVAFDRQKVLGGLLRACEKRPVSSEQLEQIADRVERQCLEAFDKEVPSKVIGNLIMQELRQLDQVAYVRFASVYREFKDVSQFLDELKPMLEKSALEKRREGVHEEAGGVPGAEA